MTIDAPRKRDLLSAWLSAHSGFRVPLHDGGSLDARMAIASLRRALPDPRESVYLLVSRDTPLIPLYIGRARNPVTRWQGHLRACVGGAPGYARWAAHFAGSLDLYVVPVNEMVAPPIPGFPVTAGAVEAQLISLAQDAHPGLLNRDGVGR